MNEAYVKYVHPAKAVVLGLSNVASPYEKSHTSSWNMFKNVLLSKRLSMRWLCLLTRAH